MRSVRRSLGLAFAETYVTLVIQFATTLVLARLLKPEEVGIYSIGAAISYVGQLIRDFGVGQYLTQERNLTRERIRAAFTLTLASAWLVGCTIAGIAAPVANFYGEPLLETVLLILAANFALIPFGSITLAYLRRELIFTPVACLNIGGALVYSIVVLALAFKGYSALSMAWASLAGVIFMVLGSTLVRPKHLPVLPGFRGLREVAAFGAYASAANIVHAVGSKSPELILGRALGVEAVGLFDRASGLIDYFSRAVMRAIYQVALPYLSKQREEDSATLRIGYIKAVSLVTVLALPFLAVVGVLAQPLVSLLLGKLWLGAVPLIPLLCVAAAIGNVFSLYTHLLTAVGRIKSTVGIVTLTHLIQIACILSFVSFGLYAVCAGLILSSVLGAILISWNLRFIVSPRDTLKAVRGSALVAVCSSIGPVAAITLLDPNKHSGLLSLVAGAATAGGGWLAAVFAIRHPIADEIRNSLGWARRLVGSILP